MDFESFMQAISNLLPNLLKGLGLNQTYNSSNSGNVAGYRNSYDANQIQNQNLSSFPKDNVDDNMLHRENSKLTQTSKKTNASQPQTNGTYANAVTNLGYPTDFVDDGRDNRTKESLSSTQQNTAQNPQSDRYYNFNPNTRIANTGLNSEQNSKNTTQSIGSHPLQNLLNLGGFGNLFKNFNIGNLASSASKILGQNKNGSLNLNKIASLLSGFLNTNKPKNSASIMQNLFKGNKVSAESSEVKILETYKDVNDVEI